MKKKFKKHINFKISNKQLHKNYSYKSLILFYFLFNFDFFFKKYCAKLYNKKLILINVYHQFKKNFYFNFHLAKSILKKNNQILKLFFKWTREFLVLRRGDTKLEKKWHINMRINLFYSTRTKKQKKALLYQLAIHQNIPTSKKERSTQLKVIYFCYMFMYYRALILFDYYKHLCITTSYFKIYKNLMGLKNKINYKINYKINCSLFKKKLNKKLKKKKLIYFLITNQKAFYSFYYNISINLLIKKKNKMTIIRSPFIYKRSREQFIRSYIMYLFKIEKLNLKNVYKITKKLELLFNKNLSGSYLKYYFNFKYIKN